MKVVILAGGFGTRFGKLTDFLPKPMIPVGPYPILWHIMRIYAHHGFNDFIICAGYRADLIKAFFLDFQAWTNDFTVDFTNPTAPQKSVHWRPKNTFHPKVTVAYTGQETLTGSRIRRITPYLGNDQEFMLTYGDGVSNVNLTELLLFHRRHGKLATLTAVFPPPRFGDLNMSGDTVTTFAEKQPGFGSYINGGFYIMNRRVLDYFDCDSNCALEKRPLETLAAEHQLQAFRHDGYWQCMDTTRDLDTLQQAWRSRSAPWKVWSDDYED
jgi:glucose-1-phosphate cytidylyltransferase